MAKQRALERSAAYREGRTYEGEWNQNVNQNGQQTEANDDQQKSEQTGSKIKMVACGALAKDKTTHINTIVVNCFENPLVPKN